MIQREITTRVYFYRGRYAHLLANSESPNRPDPALCGKAPFMFWEGTGDQNEIDKAARMPTCPQCERLVHE